MITSYNFQLRAFHAALGIACDAWNWSVFACQLRLGSLLWAGAAEGSGLVLVLFVLFISSLVSDMPLFLVG